MLLAEYDYDIDIAVQRAEEREIAFAEGIEQGIERGIEQGLEQGAYQKALETAKKLLGIRLSVEDIAKVTGLSWEEIENL